MEALYIACICDTPFHKTENSSASEEFNLFCEKSFVNKAEKFLRQRSLIVFAKGSFVQKVYNKNTRMAYYGFNWL